MSDPHATSRSRAAPRWLPWLLAGAGLAFDCAAYWPGQMSFDSAYAWWQARGGETSNIVPPAFVLVWRACRMIVDGPAAMFALHLALFWTGLGLLTRALRTGTLASAAVIGGVGFAPVVLLLRGQVWTDVALFAALVLAVGLLATAHRERGRRFLVCAWLALTYAALLRHNALPAIVPMLVWLGTLVVRAGRDEQPRRLPAAVATIAMLAVVAVAAQSLDAGVHRRVPLWPSLAEFDLAAVSIETGRLRLPDFMTGAGLDIADLAQAFRPWSNTPMLRNTRAGLRDPFDPPLSAAELATLRGAWLAALVDEPRAWLVHRWRLTRALFGTHAPDWPRELVYVDAETPYRDNPLVAANTGTLHAALMHAAAACAATPVLAAWPYLALGLFAAPWAWHRRRDTAGTVAVVCLASAWVYALPLTVLAPSAELRYLGWPCVASLLALACVMFTPRADAR